MCEHLMRCIMLCGQKKCLNKKIKKKKKKCKLAKMFVMTNLA